MKTLRLIIICFVINTYCSVAQTSQGSFQDVFISKIPRPTAPAILEITDITFSDGKGNNDNILDANENGEISFILTNKGKGDAYNLRVIIEEQNAITGIDFKTEQTADGLPSMKSKKFVFPVAGTMQLITGKAKFKISVVEANHFDADPVALSFNTQAFKNPQIAVADFSFSNNETEGKIKLGEVVNLKMIIQNQGQGKASDVNVTFSNPANIFPGGATEYKFASLAPNENKTINYEFFANKQYTNKEIPITVTVTEGYGKYGVNKTVTISLEQTLAKTNIVDIDAKRADDVNISQLSLTSDIDKNIPQTTNQNPNLYVLIFGNEDYKSYQTGLSDEANVAFARNDAKSFNDYCINTFGAKTENITFLTNATAGKMNQAIDKMVAIIKNTDGKAEVIVYYAGHGLPDEATKDAYLIPVDVSGTDLTQGIKLQSLYAKLCQFPSKKISVFLDACFTGGGREQGLIAARTMRIKPKDFELTGNIVVFTASSGEQTSMPYKEKQHGLFTYLLLKKIQETKGVLSYKDLYSYLKKEVPLKSITINSKEQTPGLLFSTDLVDKWDRWSLVE